MSDKYLLKTWRLIEIRCVFVCVCMCVVWCVCVYLGMLLLAQISFAPAISLTARRAYLVHLEWYSSYVEQISYILYMDFVIKSNKKQWCPPGSWFLRPGKLVLYWLLEHTKVDRIDNSRDGIAKKTCWILLACVHEVYWEEGRLTLRKGMLI